MASSCMLQAASFKLQAASFSPYAHCLIHDLYGKLRGDPDKTIKFSIDDHNRQIYIWTG